MASSESVAAERTAESGSIMDKRYRADDPCTGTAASDAPANVPIFALKRYIGPRGKSQTTSRSAKAKACGEATPFEIQVQQAPDLAVGSVTSDQPAAADFPLLAVRVLQLGGHPLGPAPPNL